jgi:hypothetical protein
LKYWKPLPILSGCFLIVVLSIAMAQNTASGKYVLVGWNDLGMHCVDGSDYSVFSILPPYNNLHAQLVDPNGRLVKSPNGIRLTYAAVTDPDTKSMNRTSMGGKTNFWQYAQSLFGVTLAPDMGLAGNAMPGAGNKPQPLPWQAASYEWKADGIPITPYPDSPSPVAKNYYPMMRVTAWSSTNRVLATADVVLPVSDELDCKLCHATGAAGAPILTRHTLAPGTPDQTYKWNILALHDEMNSTTLYDKARAGTPALCASCHKSNALGTTGTARTSLTQAIHRRHANAIDPVSGMLMDASHNRDACYRCHPGSSTKCLRGAMGNAVDAQGNMTMQCQSCHGVMSYVGNGREGWTVEPSCENCHTGTAVNYNGAIRQTDAFAGGVWRQPADPRFAANTGTLFKLSKGHGGLACEACHGSTHAEYPSSHGNDNYQIVKLQGHTGVLTECKTCHGAQQQTSASGGPHGLHPIGASWVDAHGDAAERSGTGACRDCHGSDYRGTVLSKALAARTFTHDGRTFSFARGTVIGCYSCHNGPQPN